MEKAWLEIHSELTKASLYQSKETDCEDESLNAEIQDVAVQGQPSVNNGIDDGSGENLMLEQLPNCDAHAAEANQKGMRFLALTNKLMVV